MKKLTKNDIEVLAKTIIAVIEKEGIAEDVCLYFNNKRISIEADYSKKGIIPEYIHTTMEDVDPHKYFKWSAYHHIMSMSFEGLLYDKLNYESGEFPEFLENLFQKLGIYYEFGDSWNITFYPIDDNMEVEYTEYLKPVPPTYIWLGNNCQDIPVEVLPIMEAWYEKSKLSGDIGSCVIGAYVEFIFNGITYHMAPCSPWQGEGSWTPHVAWVENELAKIGAVNISWHCGMLD